MVVLHSEAIILSWWLDQVCHIVRKNSYSIHMQTRNFGITPKQKLRMGLLLHPEKCLHMPQFS